MSDLSKELEAMAGSMGFNVSEQEPTQEQPANEPQWTPEQSVQENVQQSTEPQQVIQQEQAPAEEMPESSLPEDDMTEDEVEAAMLEYLSERLGKQVSSFDEFLGNQNTSEEIDERVAAINEFVRQTGRDPQDWFTYQAMNPSEMDDVSAVKTQLRNQYGDLSDSDLNLLIDNKYKLDADLYDESEIRLSQIQLRMDADKARQDIESVRSKYAAPVREQYDEEMESFIDDNWLNNMSVEVDALEGIEFDLGKDKSFTFGLDDNYKAHLRSKNERIEDFFGSYTDNQGNWDFEKWNMHQTVVDNIETIVKTAYQQGLGDGQRNLVDKAANVNYQNPSEGVDSGQGNVKSIEEQLKNALGMNNNGLTFKI